MKIKPKEKYLIVMTPSGSGVIEDKISTIFVQTVRHYSGGSQSKMKHLLPCFSLSSFMQQ